jgi:hypothetical protein
MTFNQLVIPAIALLLAVPGVGTVKASGQSQAAPLSVYEQDHMPWDTPPQDLQGVQLRGFHDGIAGAGKDFENSQRPHARVHVDYLNPHLNADQRESYLDGFQLGYERAMSHLVGGTDQPVTQLEQAIVQPPARSGTEVAQVTSPDLPPAQGSGLQRRGFNDGIARARKDVVSHRRVEVVERDASRHLKLSPDSRLEYLAAFTQGYDQFMSLQANSLQAGR